jgi:two-component system sensor histidine kinase KdpD
LLEQIFVNVIENAVVHTAAETVIKVGTVRCATTLTVSIEYDGPGIANAEADLIFHRFYQGRAGEHRRSGSGLGLSIARGFAEAIGGSIRAVPAISSRRGTRFEINLPLAQSI